MTSHEPEYVGDIPIIRISADDPFERGRQHGSLARAQIAASVGYYSELFAHSHGLEWGEVAEAAMQWASVVEAYDADLFSELRGIAEGCERSLGEILALNARGEMVYTSLRSGAGGEPRTLADDLDASEKTEGCTSFALLARYNSAGRNYTGQNWDWRQGALGSRVLLRIEQPGRPTITTIVEAGQLGRHGVNSAGIALFANGLPASARDGIGVPQTVIRRKILDQENISDALEIATERKLQIPAHFLISHRDGFAISIEATPEGHAWSMPQDGTLAHANHWEYFSGLDYQPTLGADSLYRSYLMREYLKDARAADGDAGIRAVFERAFRDRLGAPDALCAMPDPEKPPYLRWQTIASNIVDLTSGTWYLAPGMPCDEEYVELPWNLYETSLEGGDA